VIRCGGVGEVLQSNCDAYSEGDMLFG